MILTSYLPFLDVTLLYVYRPTKGGLKSLPVFSTQQACRRFTNLLVAAAVVAAAVVTAAVITAAIATTAIIAAAIIIGLQVALEAIFLVHVLGTFVPMLTMVVVVTGATITVLVLKGLAVVVLVALFLALVIVPVI